MKRYIVNNNDKGFSNRENYFVELGLYDFWLLATKILKNDSPPSKQINDIDTAFEIIKQFIKECGNTIILDLPDGYNTDHISGNEIENNTMRIIWYSVDKVDRDIENMDEPYKEIRQSIFGENLEQQYGFSFKNLIITPAYLLVYANEREIPDSITTDEEVLNIFPHPTLKIYEHRWGSFNKEPILQYNTRYYCNDGLVCVIAPKACRNSFRPDDFFEDNSDDYFRSI
jgi:hypothetical protein